eukprot:scaffold46985_cov38-Tisochrysis_lutea.AAC.1
MGKRRRAPSTSRASATKRPSVRFAYASLLMPTASEAVHRAEKPSDIVSGLGPCIFSAKDAQKPPKCKHETIHARTHCGLCALRDTTFRTDLNKLLNDLAEEIARESERRVLQHQQPVKRFWLWRQRLVLIVGRDHSSREYVRADELGADSRKHRQR